VDGSPTSSNRWLEGLGTVIVTDGRLTISTGAGAMSNCLAFVELSALEPATIAEWRAVYFGTTANAGNAANLADPDGDGVPNLIEYAAGLIPTNAAARAWLTVNHGPYDTADRLFVDFLRNTNAHDISFFVEATTDLQANTWSCISSNLAGIGWAGAPVLETPDTASRIHIRAYDTQPTVNFTSRFLRVRVTQP